MLLAERLKLLRAEHRYYQRELADLLGISLRAYQFYEDGTNEPKLKSLVALADFYGVTTDYLLGRTDQRNDSNLPRP